MGEVKWTPGEFARIAALPPGHPDRVQAEAEPAFEAWNRMREAFESSAGAPLTEAEMVAPRAELSARLQRELGIAPVSAGARARAAAPPRPERAGALDGLLGWLAAPAGRAALALGVVAIVAAGGWWLSSRPVAPPALRGADTSGVPVLAEPEVSGGRLVLSWTAAPGADAYRVVFYDAELAETARIDSVTSPRCELVAGALPRGLASGGRVTVEIVALAHGDPLSRSRPLQVTLP